MQEARHHSPEMVAAVAAPGEAGKMAFGVVGAGLLVGSRDRTPDVSERGVDPFEGGHSGRPAPGAGADCPVVAAGMVEGGPAAEGVGYDLGVGGRPALCAACDLGLAEAPDRDRLGLARSALGVCRNRGHERRPAGCAPSPPAARTHAAEVGVVHPQPPRRRLFPLAPGHPAMIFCFIAQAVPCLIPNRRPGSTEENPFLAVTTGWMAANQTVSGSLVEWKIVPAVSEVCFLQRLH